MNSLLIVFWKKLLTCGVEKVEGLLCKVYVGHLPHTLTARALCQEYINNDVLILIIQFPGGGAKRFPTPLPPPPPPFNETLIGMNTTSGPQCSCFALCLIYDHGKGQLNRVFGNPVSGVIMYLGHITLSGAQWQ